MAKVRGKSAENYVAMSNLVTASRHRDDLISDSRKHVKLSGHLYKGQTVRDYSQITNDFLPKHRRNRGFQVVGRLAFLLWKNNFHYSNAASISGVSCAYLTRISSRA